MQLEIFSDEELKKFLHYAYNDEATWLSNKVLFDSSVSEPDLKVTYMRSIMTLASPVHDDEKRYISPQDSEAEQKSKA